MSAISRVKEDYKALLHGVPACAVPALHAPLDGGKQDVRQ